MSSAAERMKAMRDKRRARDHREIRLSVPDPNSPAVRARIAEQIKALDAGDDREALAWIESVSEFDNDATR